MSVSNTFGDEKVSMRHGKSSDMEARITFNQTTTRRDLILDGEHPDVIVSDVMGRARPDARIIVIANEKGGVGKSTIAFHLCVALANAGLTVAAIDLDKRQQTLSHALISREGTARRLRVPLALPKQQVLQVLSGAMLCQEISRIGWDANVIVIDAAGHDSPIARRAIALADTLVTPVNNSFVDLDVLARLHPVSLEVTSKGGFAQAVLEIREARIRADMPILDWVVVPNRIRKDSSHNHGRFEETLQKLAQELGFRISQGLTERVAYRELFLLGLTHLDLGRLPEMASANANANREILALIADIAAMDTPQDTAQSGPECHSNAQPEDILDIPLEWQLPNTAEAD
jgi:chromosome partitioning protein